MTGTDDIEDIDAALEAHLGNPDIAKMVDPQHRRGGEKRMRLSPDDGRLKKATGRTRQFNCKMRPELHRQIVQASRRSGKSMTLMCEEALVAYLATMEGRSHDNA